MPKKKTGRKRLRPISAIKRQLWSLCSEYNRRKDSNETGHVKCVSCGEWRHWKGADAGHWIPRSRGGKTYYEATNIHPQCKGCNCYGGEYAKARYSIYMSRRYGTEHMEWLERQSREQARYRRADYEQMIEEYKIKLKDLEK